MEFNIDSKGVKRGACQSCDECPEFEWNKNVQCFFCSYWGCLPVKHLKVSTSVHQEILPNQQQKETLSNVDSTYSFELSEEDYAAIVDNAEASSSENNEQQLEANESNHGVQVVEMNETLDLSVFIPSTFPPKIQNAIDKKEALAETDKSFIIRSIVKDLIKANLDSTHVIKEIAVLLTNKFPDYLKCEIGVGEPHEQTETRMKYCKKYFKMKGKRRDSAEAGPSSTISVNSGPRNHLRSTRKSRMGSAAKVTAEEILQKFPELRRKDMMLWELAELAGISVENLRMNWAMAIDDICNALNLHGKNLNLNGQSVAVLFNLPRLFTKAKESGKILHTYPFQRGTPIEDTIPYKNDPPKLIVISNSPFNDLQLMCYVDGRPIFEAKAFEATLLLMAVYWIFQVAFPENAKQQFAFIAVAVLKELAYKDISKEILKKITLTNALRQCNLLPNSNNDS